MVGIRHGERSEVLMEVEGELVAPACDGVVGDMDVVELVEDVNDHWCWQRVNNEEIGDEGDDGAREVHFVPVEGDGQGDVVETLDGIGGDVEGAAGKREIDFM